MKIYRRVAMLLSFLLIMFMMVPAFAEETQTAGQTVSAETEEKTPDTFDIPYEPVVPRVPTEQELFNIKRTTPLSAFERDIVEQGFRLLPYNHPFVVAYEKTFGDRIDTYAVRINDVIVSGVPFEMGGRGNYKGFNADWWSPSENEKYPLKGLDCAKYIAWIYKQLDINLPAYSTGLFFSGKTGVKRTLPGMRTHYVIPTLSEAKVGDIALNSTQDVYQSGNSCHVQMYIGTADLLGISEELKKLIPAFPCDAHLVLDCGWSDGYYYYDMMQRIGVMNGRQSMAGVGVQFFTSIKKGDTYLYESPRKLNPDKLNYFWDMGNDAVLRVESVLEYYDRLLQHNPSVDTKYPMNLSRPVKH